MPESSIEEVVNGPFLVTFSSNQLRGIPILAKQAVMYRSGRVRILLSDGNEYILGGDVSFHIDRKRELP